MHYDHVCLSLHIVATYKLQSLIYTNKMLVSLPAETNKSESLFQWVPSRTANALAAIGCRHDWIKVFVWQVPYQFSSKKKTDTISDDSMYPAPYCHPLIKYKSSKSQNTGYFCAILRWPPGQENKSNQIIQIFATTLHIHNSTCLGMQAHICSKHKPNWRCFIFFIH
jgi:hypothetical protein